MHAAVFVSALVLSLTAYFGYYALYGSSGLVSFARISNEIELKRSELRMIVEARQRMELRVKMLSTEIDPDLLDEQARLTFGLSAPGELVILRQKP